MSFNESRLDAWLRRRPPTATCCELRWDSVSGVQTVARWEKDELERNGALLIGEAALDHFEDLEANARYEVVWLDEDGRVLKTKALRLERERDKDDELSDEGFVKTAETPNAHGLTMQLMKHAETDRRLHNIAEANLLKFYRDALADARAEMVELRAENRELRRRWKAAEAKADSEPDLEGEAHAAAYEKMATAVSEYLIPVLAARVGGPQH